ncbi:MAG: hypothetical protein R2827_07180 [Bdellovibrionales bacterium]
MGIRQIVSSIITLLVFTTVFAQDLWKDVREANLEGNVPKTLEHLLSMDESKLSPSELTLKDFILGFTYFKNRQFDSALQWFGHHIRKQGTLRGYAHFYQGEIFMERSEWMEAKQQYQLAIKHQVPRNYNYKARYQMGVASVQLKHWNSAGKDFRYVERKWRGDLEHPKVVFELMKVEFAKRKIEKPAIGLVECTIDIRPLMLFRIGPTT